MCRYTVGCKDIPWWHVCLSQDSYIAWNHRVLDWMTGFRFWCAWSYPVSVHISGPVSCPLTRMLHVLFCNTPKTACYLIVTAALKCAVMYRCYTTWSWPSSLLITCYTPCYFSFSVGWPGEIILLFLCLHCCQKIFLLFGSSENGWGK